VRRVRLVAATRLGLVAGGLWALWIGPASLLAGPTLRITSPASGTVFAPGQTLEITVEATPLAFRTVLVAGTQPLGFSQISRAAPYRFQIKIPADIRPGPYALTAFGDPQDGPAVHSQSTRIAIERPDSPSKLESDRLVVLDIGDDWDLTVTGTFADGSTVSLRRSTLTRCTSDRPAVASVNDEGRLTAVRPGSARVTITNGGAQVVVPVTVAVPHRQ
jgi:Bacterial Ig-like domain (group 2)